DEGNSFHPDERQILFRVTQTNGLASCPVAYSSKDPQILLHSTLLTLPQSFAQFLDPVNSPLNPHFFAYGSFPLYLLAFIGDLMARFSPHLGTMANLTLIGRVLSSIFHCGPLVLIAWL